MRFAAEPGRCTVRLCDLVMDFSVEVLKAAVDAHAAYAVLDHTGAVVEVNSKLLELCEYTRAEVLGKCEPLFNCGEHSPAFWRHFWSTLKSGETWRGVLCNRRKSGRLYWADATVCLSLTLSGEERYIALLTDVTGLVSSEEKTVAARDLNAEVARVAKVGSWELLMCDLKPRWSQVTREIHEVDAAFEPNLEDGINFYKEGEDRHRIQQLVENTMREGGRWDEEFRLITATGREIWVRAIGEAEVVDGECTRLFGTFQDIDIRKRAQLESERVSCILRDSLASAKNFGFITTDTTGLITVFNAGAEAMLGYSASEIVGKCRSEIFHDPEELEARALELSKEFGRPVKPNEVLTVVADRKGSETREWTCVRKDGSVFPLSLAITPVADAKGMVSGYVGIGIDVSEKRRADQAIKERERLLETARDRLALATKAGGVGIWDHNLADGTLTWDEQMFELFRVEPEQFRGGLDDWLKHLHPEDKDRLVEESRQAIECAKPYNTEYRIIHANGDVRFLRSLANVYYDEEGKPVRMVGTNWDITEQATQRERLIALAEESKQASQAKTTFLANMSHEIRTPLNGIIGMTSLLLDSEHLDVEARHHIRVIHSSSETLLSLINDILDFSKVEAGKTELEEMPFDLRETLHDFACMIAVKADKKELNFSCSVGPKLPALLIGDPARLRQVLVNLTGNAIKFTNKGSVEVVANVDDVSGEEIMIKFTVRDTGVGVAKSKQNALFDRFTQADSSVTRKFGGTGLGLAISKHLAELMGGKIGLSSVDNGGSEFWFTARFKVKQLCKAQADGSKVQGAHIIVASANVELRRELKELLTLWRANVIETDGSNALRQLTPDEGKQCKADAIILDTDLNGVDAVSVARAIRADKRTSSTCIVMLHALGRRSRADLTLDLCNVSLFRPPNPSKLFDSLAKLLNREEIETAGSRAPPSSGALPVVGRRILLVEDNPINQVVVQSMLKRLDLKADVAANGFEALHLLEMLEYDLVLMDVQMPEMDGLEATRRIRAQAKTSVAELPIIAMTAHARVEDRQQCLLAGMSDYMSKPITFAGLVQMLNKWQPK